MSLLEEILKYRGMDPILKDSWSRQATELIDYINLLEETLEAVLEGNGEMSDVTHAMILKALEGSPLIGEEDGKEEGSAVERGS